MKWRGKVVAQSYNLCTDIWGGCPAVESIPSGIDSSTSTESSELSSNTGLGDISESCSDENQERFLTLELDSAAIPKRSLEERLKDAINSKMMKNVSYEKRMMQLTKEGMALKE